jgi:hypothetical protein
MQRMELLIQPLRKVIEGGSRGSRPTQGFRASVIPTEEDKPMFNAGGRRA